MALTQDIKKSAENGVEEVKKIAGEGRKPFFAIIGLNDLFLEQSKAAAERAQARFDAYRDSAIANFTTVREELDKALADSRERANELQKTWTATDSHDLQANLQEYFNTVVRSYASLAERGERIVDQVSKTLGESQVVKRVTEVGQGVAKQVEDAAEQAEVRVRRTVSAVSDQAAEVADKVAQNADEPKASSGVKLAAVKTADQVEETTAEAVVAKPVAEQETIDVAVAAPSTPVRKAPARKTAPQKAPATTTAAKTTTAKTTAVKPAATRTTAAKSTAAKSTAAKSTAVKTAAVKPSAPRSTTAKPSVAKTTATKTTAAKSTASKTPAADKATDSQ